MSRQTGRTVKYLFRFGGAIHNDTTGTIKITDCEFVSNRASFGSAGAIERASGLRTEN